MKKVSSEKKFSPEFKAKVAIKALKELKTITKLAFAVEIHPTRIATWKKHFLENSSAVFSEKQTGSKETEATEARLYEQIGKLQMQNEWLKKSYSEVQPVRTQIDDLKNAGIEYKRAM